MIDRNGLLQLATLMAGLCLFSGCTTSTVIPPGTPLPKLEVAGWVNGDAPNESELSGKVLVIDVWAFW